MNTELAICIRQVDYWEDVCLRLQDDWFGCDRRAKPQEKERLWRGFLLAESKLQGWLAKRDRIRAELHGVRHLRVVNE